MAMETKLVTGSEALALGAVSAGVTFAAGYPGSPSTKTMDALRAIPEGPRTEWCTNEKVAFEKCLGVSITGQRALVCVKSVGMNIALDPVMVANMTGVRGGLVILLGDDPGAWGSQNEQDSRWLAPFTELPMLEPASPQEAYRMMQMAFHWSEQLHTPFIVRITRSFSLHPGDLALEAPPSRPPGDPTPITAGRSAQRWFSTPANAVRLHAEHHQRLEQIERVFEASPFHSQWSGDAPGIVTAGFVGQKVREVGARSRANAPAHLHLGVLYPLPHAPVIAFLRSQERVLVFEENEPWVESSLRELAQREGLPVRILGKETGDVPRVGELFRWQIAERLNALLPGFVDPQHFPPEAEQKPSPAKEGLCEGCPYHTAFMTLKELLAEWDEDPVFLGDPGCAVRLWQPPVQLLDVKYSMGSSISIGAGIAQADPHLRVIACPGDSSFYHTGINALIDASYRRVRMSVLLLDNGTTALSGCQPHPGVAHASFRQIPLEALIAACQVDHWEVVDAFDPGALREAYHRLFQVDGLGVLILRGACVLLES